ncbi:DUF1244 domain-containing protein [Thermomonas sp.]
MRCVRKPHYRPAALSWQNPRRDEAREAVYGMPFSEIKARHHAEPTPEQLATMGAASG